MRYSQQEIEEQYQKLPQALKGAMFNVDIADILFEIGKKAGLNVEKIGFMAEETGYVILGLTRPQRFAGALAERLKINEETAREIASDISRKIFYSLREELKSAYEFEVSKEGPAQQGPAPKMEEIRRPPLAPTQTPASLSAKPEIYSPGLSPGITPGITPREKDLKTPVPAAKPQDVREDGEIKPEPPKPEIKPDSKPEFLGSAIFAGPRPGPKPAPTPPESVKPSPVAPPPPPPKKIDPYKEEID